MLILILTANDHPPDPARIHKDNQVAKMVTQPHVTVERKALGTLTVSKDSVTAGSMVDLRIDYKFSEAVEVPVQQMIDDGRACGLGLTETALLRLVCR